MKGRRLLGDAVLRPPPPGAVGYPASKKPEAWKVFAISRVHKQPFELFESEACVARSMPTRA